MKFLTVTASHARGYFRGKPARLTGALSVLGASLVVWSMTGVFAAKHPRSIPARMSEHLIVHSDDGQSASWLAVGDGRELITEYDGPEQT